MGARINFVFKDSEPAVGEPSASVVLYSHYGQDSWEPDLAEALLHARPRITESSFGTRMIISYLIQHNILDETDFGIYAVSGNNYDLGEETVVIDFANQTVTYNHPVKFDAFVNAYGPRLFTEHAVV